MTAIRILTVTYANRDRIQREQRDSSEIAEKSSCSIWLNMKLFFRKHILTSHDDRFTIYPAHCTGCISPVQCQIDASADSPWLYVGMYCMYRT